MSDTLARHISPDGQLTLLVTREPEPDGGWTIILGFEESPWHVHVEQLALHSEGEEAEQLALQLAADVLADRMLIVVVPGDDYPDIRLADCLEDEVDYLPTGETPELRFWSGRRTTFEELIDRTVTYKPL
jgi:hypothetical protein